MHPTGRSRPPSPAAPPDPHASYQEYENRFRRRREWRDAANLLHRERGPALILENRIARTAVRCWFAHGVPRPVTRGGGCGVAIDRARGTVRWMNAAAVEALLRAGLCWAAVAAGAA